MGQLVVIKAKDDADLDNLNASLEKLEIENSFLTQQNLKNWVDDINYNTDSPQKHLKPENNDLTIDEFKKMFPSWTIIGELTFDVAYSRTSQEEASKYAKFIVKNKISIEFIRGGDELISRYKLTPKQKEVITSLEKISEEPKKLPLDKQNHPDLQSGLYLCKSFSINPFWVIFGNVKTPTFLKTKIYEDDIYNNIYRDKKGFGYLMLPLLPLGNKISEFINEVYEYAYNMGLREAFGFILPLIYGIEFNNIDTMVSDFNNFYTEEELNERFKQVFIMSKLSYGYNQVGGFVWRNDINEFKPCGQNYGLIRSRCQLLTALSKTLDVREVEDIIEKELISPVP